MSLKSRVESATGSRGYRTQAYGLSAVLLKQQMQEVLPPDRLAVMVKENPQRARNEVRIACRQIMDTYSWRILAEEHREQFIDEVLDAVFGFGPIESLLGDESVTEIMINGCSKVFFEREGKLFLSDTSFETDDQVRALIDRILGPLGRRVDESSPMVNARLPEGHRVHAVVPPLSLDGPTLTIRKFSEHVITLEEMEVSGGVDRRISQLFEWAISARLNIAVSGSTGSGKTTLLNALSCLIPKDERIVTIEDSAELRFFEHPHVVRLEARPANAEGLGCVTIRDLVTNALRMRPDRIVVGECRGAEALDMLQAMSTGHDGSLTTLHANSAVESVSRLTTLVRYAAELPVDVIEAAIGHAIQLVVQTARATDGSRFVSEIAELSFDEEARICRVSSFFRRDPWEKTGSWTALPLWVDGLPARGIASETEVEEWKRSCLP